MSHSKEVPGDATDPENRPRSPRQFHNLHAAAAWIAKHWPDFDLEDQHPVAWQPVEKGRGRLLPSRC